MKRLLVVDEPRFARALERLLDEATRLTVAASFDEACAALAQPFDVALVNASHVPSGKAIEIVEQLRRQQPQAVRILTSADFDKGDALALLHGPLVDARLRKPFTFQEFEQALARARTCRTP